MNFAEFIQQKDVKNRNFREFASDIKSGETYCISGCNIKKVNGLLYHLIKGFSLFDNKNLIYITADKQHGKQNLYLNFKNVSQPAPVKSYKKLYEEIKKATTHYTNPVIFIKDYFKIVTEIDYWQTSNNKRFRNAAEWLKGIAEKHKITFFITMPFDTEEALKQYYLHQANRITSIFRPKRKKSYFDRQYFINGKINSSFQARQKLRKQFLYENPEIKMTSKKVIVTSIIASFSDGHKLFFRHPFPVVVVFTAFIFDRRIIPGNFKGYEVSTVMCTHPPKKYFPAGKNIPFEVKYAPEHFINFVDNHLNLISWKLNKPNMTKEEALNALTGNFARHTALCKEHRD